METPMKSVCICSTTLFQKATSKTFLEKQKLGRILTVMTIDPITKDVTVRNSTLCAEADDSDYENRKYKQ